MNKHPSRQRTGMALLEVGMVISLLTIILGIAYLLVVYSHNFQRDTSQTLSAMQQNSRLHDRLCGDLDGEQNDVKMVPDGFDVIFDDQTIAYRFSDSTATRTVTLADANEMPLRDSFTLPGCKFEIENDGKWLKITTIRVEVSENQGLGTMSMTMASVEP